MPQHERNAIRRLASNAFRFVAPVFFGEKRGSFEGFNTVIERANVVVNEIQKSMGEQGIEMIRALQVLVDEATDLVGTLPAGERTGALNQIQEVFDLPVFAYTEAWAKTIELMIAGNKAAIAASRKRTK